MVSNGNLWIMDYGSSIVEIVNVNEPGKVI